MYAPDSDYVRFVMLQQLDKLTFLFQLSTLESRRQNPYPSDIHPVDIPADDG